MWEFTLCLSLAVVMAMPVGAHESEPDWPTPQQLSQVQPAIRGSLPIAQRLVDRWAYRLDAEQATLLRDVRTQLQFMQRLEAGTLGAEQQLTDEERRRLVDYFRWKTEQALFRFLECLTEPNVIFLNLAEDVPDAQPERPIRIDERDNLVLLKVTVETAAAPADRHLMTTTWDLSGEQLDGPLTVDITSGGTTWVLATVRRLPADQTISHFIFRDSESGKTLHRETLTFQAPPRGQIAIDVVDAAGQSVPVIMSITSPETGRLCEPADAVDLRTVLNDIVPHLNLPGRGYMFYLPGRRRGRYWIVKPPIEMPLATGSWTVRVLRGLEFSPIEQTVTVRENEWTRVRLQTERWTDMRQLGWYSGDDHVHAQLQNSEDARKLMTYTRAVDLNVANILEMGDVMRTFYAQRGFGPEFRVQHQDHWLVPGQEDPRSMLGHAIGLNLQAKVRDLSRYLSNDWVASEIHRQGGLYGHTHVGPNACFVHREMALFTPHNIVDFNSIMQADLGTELYYDFLNMGFKMTATAGADTPYGGTIGAVRTYAYTGDSDVFSPDAWFEAVRRGRTFVTNGPMIDLTIDGHRPGDEIVFDQDARLTVSARAWGGQGWSAPSRLRLVKFGKTHHEIEADTSDQTELRLTTELDVGQGFWMAAHAESLDGSQAHTTPIYVTRKGLRHWDVATAAALIDRQMDVLREIDGEVRSAETLMDGGGRLFDYWNRRTAEQADRIRIKIDETRQIYEDLQAQLERQIRSTPRP